jgi:hypothetical protein
LKTIEEFYNFFNGIPDNKWCVKRLFTSNGKACALGLISKKGIMDSVVMRLSLPFNVNVGDIKDNRNNFFLDLGDTPKERILNALILKSAGIFDELV